MGILAPVQDFIRWSDWGPSKIPILCTVFFYVGLANGDVSAAFSVDLGLFVLFASLHSALGYVANDWGDRRLDALHQKPNAFARLTPTQGILALSGLLALALMSGLPFAQRPMVLPLWFGWAFVALGYSLRPLRLKERGAWGLTVSSLAQWALPVLLAFAVLYRFHGWDMVTFTLAITISGATLEIAHQRWDRTRDLGTETGTFGSRISVSRLDWLYVRALYVDKIALGALLTAVVVEIEPVRIGSLVLSPGLPLLAIYGILFAASVRETIHTAQHGELLDPYYRSERCASKLLHETLPNLIVPTYLMILATLYQPLNGLVLLLFLFWRLVLGQADWQWPLRAVWSWLTR